MFTQCVGSRTHAPEILGESGGELATSLATAGRASAGFVGFGGALGEITAWKLFAFPPIWTTIVLTIASDGSSTGVLAGHSLFPSVSFYLGESLSDPAKPTGYLKKASYDGVAHCASWMKCGWGYSEGLRGCPCRWGNPWGIMKDDALYGTDPGIEPAAPKPYPPERRRL